MRVFVTGGTGAIGRYAVTELVAAGHEVSALVRSAAKAASVRKAGATPVEVSLFDPDGLSRAFEGHDAIVNLATALPATADFARMSAWGDNIRIRTEGSANVMRAARAAGVRRVLQESVVMIYKGKGAEWIDEGDETDNFPMAKSNLAAEASALEFTAGGGEGVVLRFGWFYGKGARHSEEFFELARRRGIAIMMGAPSTFLSSIHVADGGRAVVKALSIPSGIYNIVDDNPLTKKEYADALASAAGRRHYVRLPGRLSHLMGNGTTSLTRSLRVSNRKFREQSGWHPHFPSAREGWSTMAGT